MIEVKQHLDENTCQKLRTALQGLEGCYWRDRSRHNPNWGLDGTPGHYQSCAGLSLPQDLRQTIAGLAPRVDGLELDEWLVNRTPVGGYMPPHQDLEGHFAVGLLSLQSNSGALAVFADNRLEAPCFYPDRAGQWIGLHDLTQVHAVAPASRERFVVVFLYR